MKIQFEFSATEAADWARRYADRSQAVRDSRWYAAACWSALLSLVLFFALDASFMARAAFSALFCVIVFFIYMRIWGSSGSAGYLKYYREQLGGDGPFLYEVEIGPDGITTRQRNTETKRSWAAVKDVVEAPDAVELLLRPGGLLIVTDRAFQTPEQRAAFLRMVRGFLAEASDRSRGQTVSP